MKTYQFPGPGAASAEQVKPSGTDKSRLTDLNKANVLIAQEITFFDHHRVRSLGGQVAEKTAEMPVMPLTTLTAQLKPEDSPQAVKNQPGAAQSPPPPESGPLQALRPAPETTVSEKKEPSWLISVKWLTRLFMSLVFIVWIFVLGVLVGRGSLWESPDSPIPKPRKAEGPPPVVLESEPPAAQARPQIQAAPSTPAPIPLEPYQRAGYVPEPEPDQAGSSEAIGIIAEESYNNPVPLPSITETQVQAQAVQVPPEAQEDDSYWPAKPEGRGLFTVQIATARSQDEALQIAQKFQGRQFQAYFYRNSRGQYPVRAGRYPTKEEAEMAKAVLAQAGARKPYVSKLNQ
ncbi:MAG: SPOR domain-containing protein [Deltaproteobacteria bacterium]|nr:SPOR domain-containing protein [Deltaproteobacteria bacterium]